MDADALPVYRPPSEAESLILQVTTGCSYNACTFCGMYRDRRFRVRKLDEIREEIRAAAAEKPETSKVFLGDGDGLIAPAGLLLEVLAELRGTFSRLRRVSAYASPQALAARSIEELRRLCEAGLELYYLGVESGDDEVLTRLCKGVRAEEMILCARKATEAGASLSTMILLGVGGRELSAAHARGSARVISSIAPRYLSTLVVTPVPGTPLMDEVSSGRFPLLSPLELAAELRTFLSGLELQRTVFRSNHASNYLPLEGTLNRDKPRLLRRLDEILASPEDAPFRPEWMRGL